MVLKSMAEGYGGIVSNARPAIFKVTSHLLDKPDDDSEMEFVSSERFCKRVHSYLVHELRRDTNGKETPIY